MLTERRERPEREKKMLEKAMAEYNAFRCHMLSKPAGEIYDASRKICFFECIHEYFGYSREISREFLEAAVQGGEILEGLWETYQKYEYLGIDTWEQVEEILDKYASIQMVQESRTEGRRL